MNGYEPINFVEKQKDCRSKEKGSCKANREICDGCCSSYKSGTERRKKYWEDFQGSIIISASLGKIFPGCKTRTLDEKMIAIRKLSFHREYTISIYNVIYSFHSEFQNEEIPIVEIGEESQLSARANELVYLRNLLNQMDLSE